MSNLNTPLTVIEMESGTCAERESRQYVQLLPGITGMVAGMVTQLELLLFESIARLLTL